MGIFTFVKRVVFYGALTSIFTLPVAYELGYNRCELDNAVNNQKTSKLERIANDKFSVKNPDDYKEYIVDFQKRTVVPYSPKEYQNKKLDEVFSR